MAILTITPPATEESDTLAFKREATLQALAPTVVAMLNHRGGAIFVGYSDTGELLGLAGEVIPLAHQLEQKLSEAISPEEIFQITCQEQEGRSGLLIEVPPGGRKPYVFDGRIFMRIGQKDHPATATMISRMILEREHTEERWERSPAVGVEIDQLDQREVTRTLEATEMQHAQPFLTEKEAPFAALERLNLVRDGWPTQSAVILFKTEQVRRYTQASVRAVVFADANLKIISDERLFSEGAFALFERLFNFLQSHLPVVSRLTSDSLQRIAIPAYPTAVLREAIINALIHRDYQDQASVQVRLFLDRLEIWNPGTLPDEYVQDAEARTVSRPRNPDIARVFHLRRYAELWGTGLWRIRQEMAQAGLPSPEWHNEFGGVQLILRRSVALSAAAPTVGASEILPRVAAFLAATKPGERFTRTTYQNRFAPDISERSARNDLQLLLRQGYLRQTGQGYYRAYVRTEKPFETDESLA